jgi:hypothetical protein
MANYVPIHLSNEFNHKGILEEDIESQFNGLLDQGVGRKKHFFKSSYYPASNMVIEINNIPFYLPDKDMKKYDNIKCFGQKLVLNEDYYTKVHIISFNDFTESEDIMELFFEHDASEVETISSLPWGKAGKSEINDNNFKFVKDFFVSDQCVLPCKNTILVDVGCTLCSIKILNHHKKLCAIQLPENPMLHIFSITLEV